MSKVIDLTMPAKTFVVSTTVTQHGVAYMGPDVKVNAHDARDAERRVTEAGHKVNSCFPPQQVEPKPWRL